MSNFSPTNFEFADDSPVQKGRKHRRGRGQLPVKSNSFKSSGHHSPAASSSLNAQKSPADQQTQYYTANEWDASPNNTSKTIDDHNSCAGSLTYSASSSVQSGMSSGGESSNDSSFADIIKLIDSEGEGASEIKAFIAARSEAASDEGRGEGGAVAGWMQRVDARSKQQQRDRERQQMLSAMAASGRQGKAKASVPLNYSRDESDDEQFGENNVLETITGRDDDVARRHTITVTSRSQKSASPRGDTNTSPLYNSANPSRHGTVTPPPNTRNKRTSTPPGFASAPPIVRTNSHRSKSSSDGSWDTPTASPPNSSSRPPHARSTAISMSASRRKSGGKGETTQDVSEAVYTKFWMCGFTDAFNFDNLKKP